MATMEVILATKIEGLGAEADLVTVKAGYGRNYLIPKGLAHEATASNRRFIANLQAARAKREAEELSAAQEVAAKISGLTVDLTLEVGQGVRRHHQPEHSRCPDRSGRGSGPPGD